MDYPPVFASIPGLKNRLVFSDNPAGVMIRKMNGAEIGMDRKRITSPVGSRIRRMQKHSLIACDPAALVQKENLIQDPTTGTLFVRLPVNSILRAENLATPADGATPAIGQDMN